MMPDGNWATELLKDRPALGRSIKAARQAKGWSQQQLASATGVSVFTVSRWEHGKGVRPHHLVTLASLLDLPGAPKIPKAAAQASGSPPAHVLTAIQTVYDITEGRGPLWEGIERTVQDAMAKIRRLAQGTDR